MTGAGVLTTGGAVVVGSVARSVVVVVVALEERVVRRTVGETAADAHTTAAVAISDEGVPPLRIATERHGNGVTLRVATVHRLTPPVLSHTVLLLESGRERILCGLERLKPNGFGQNADLCDAKADIYINNRTFCQTQSYEGCNKIYPLSSESYRSKDISMTRL